MINIIFIAPPAGGKGTQSRFLVRDYGYEHISAGKILRKFASLQNPLSMAVKNIVDQGAMVDDSLMLTLINKKISSLKGKPFIFDGFPRTLFQAKEFSLILKQNNITDYIVIYLKLDENTALKRTLGRINCSCNKIYNIYDDDLKPKVENICDECGKILKKRSDDNPESFKKRFNIYLNNIEPVVDYYHNLNKLHILDASLEAKKLYLKIKEIIND